MAVVVVAFVGLAFGQASVGDPLRPTPCRSVGLAGDVHDMVVIPERDPATGGIKGYALAFRTFQFQVPGRQVEPLVFMSIRNNFAYGTTEARAEHLRSQHLRACFDLIALGARIEARGNQIVCTGVTGHPLVAAEFDPIDSDRFPGADSPQSLARYYAELLKAYVTLFFQYQLPEDSWVMKGTDDGRILKRIYLDAKQHGENFGRAAPGRADLEEAIKMLDEDQRRRLYLLPMTIPQDWTWAR